MSATDKEIAANAAALLLTGYRPEVVAGILRMVAEGNEEICGLTPSDSGRRS
jgi:hypothetical protein